MGWEDLANAIVEQAAVDYRVALKTASKFPSENSKRIEELEKFFRSTWFSVLTKVDGEWLMREIRRDVFENPHRSTTKHVLVTMRTKEREEERKWKKYAD